MARSSKHGRNKKGPAHLRYMSRDQRTTNKRRRILKYNGAKFLAAWEQALPTWKSRHRVAVK